METFSYFKYVLSLLLLICIFLKFHFKKYFFFTRLLLKLPTFLIVQVISVLFWRSSCNTYKTAPKQGLLFKPYYFSFCSHLIKRQWVFADQLIVIEFLYIKHASLVLVSFIITSAEENTISKVVFYM